jgi:arylsulfatase A-like enzyme
MAKEGMLFTDYYAEASCTAGRANFITGELPIRTGMTTVGQAGRHRHAGRGGARLPPRSSRMGYATGQFGKNHLGDKNEFLPTVHGFDEFFGYLYHLDAMEDPAHPNYPQELLNVVGPRNMVHSWATDTDDPTEMPRWGKIGKQKIEDAGAALSQATWKPWTTRSATSPSSSWTRPRPTASRSSSGSTRPACTSSRISRRNTRRCATRERLVGRGSRHGPARRRRRLVMQKLKDMGVDDNTIVVFTTDNGTEVFTWPDGGTDAVRAVQGHGAGRRLPRACILRWPGHVPADSVQNGIFSGLDWFPTFVAAAGNPNITEELLKGKNSATDLQEPSGRLQPDGRHHRQGSVRASRNLLSRRKHVGAVRIDDYKYRFIDQPAAGWVKRPTRTCPYITNLRLDPFERTGWPNNGTKDGRSNTSTGSSTNSGASCSSSR